MCVIVYFYFSLLDNNSTFTQHLNKKDYNYAITDSAPLSIIQQLASEKVPSETSLTIER
jgi:hypothetical protein